MEYDILYADDLDNMLAQIRELRLSGWVPCGGLAYGQRKWAVLMTRDPMRKLFHTKATAVVNKASVLEQP